VSLKGRAEQCSPTHLLLIKLISWSLRIAGHLSVNLYVLPWILHSVKFPGFAVQTSSIHNLKDNFLPRTMKLLPIETSKSNLCVLQHSTIYSILKP
ncbi:hypothetical protein XENORESO_002200, partial [Xenotaenia resolanae]